MPPAARADYGVDAPPVVLTFGMLAIIFTFVGIFIGSAQGIGASIGPWVAALLCGGTCGYMLYASKRGKPALWQRTLDDLQLSGREHALDIGCGRGLVTVAVAKRLPSGSVTGIDIWRNKDQSGNSRVNAELNLRREGVEERVEIVDADMTDLPFEDGRFDLVTASLSIHNLPLEDDRAAAVRELMRVTRRGGRVVIIDIGRTAEYAALLEADGWEDVARSSRSFAVYPPARTVSARKPKGRGTRR